MKAMKAMPLPKHTISAISQYKPPMMFMAANWRGHAAWPRLSDSGQSLGKSEKRAADKFPDLGGCLGGCV